MKSEECFEKIKDVSNDAMRLRWFAKKSALSRQESINNSFESLEVGSISNTCASVHTTTISGGGKSEDVVIMNVYDADSDTELEVLFSKEDCLEFMSYLATAAYSLRN